MQPDDVEGALFKITQTNGDRSVKLAKDGLAAATDRAMRNGKVGRNVARLALRPKGASAGRPSYAMTAVQAAVPLKVAVDDTTLARCYTTVALLTGVRTEEMRELT